ncbi:MAG: pantoate kinase, partial [Halobacteriota archaeon]|nr:pantoate kinase [Halobacteriota archaeon]
WASQAYDPGSNPGCRIMVKTYAPSHITGFFEVVENSDPALMGSRGCGITLEDGCLTEVKKSEENRIFINGKLSDAPTTAFVVKKMALEPVEIRSSFYVPLSSGFGASGAGALSTAYALNGLFEKGLNKNEAGRIAHLAEVYNKTGLGDVIGQVAGGVVIRKGPGAPGNAVIEKISTGDARVGYVVLGSISTKSILEDPPLLKAINRQGKMALKELLKHPTLDDFMRLSKRFATDTGLISERARDAVEAVESDGGLASMAMLGDTVFAIGDFHALSEYGDLVVSRITISGAKLF